MVVDRGNHIALARRANSTLYPGKWGLPCGYIELGESFLDGAKREVNEEIGIDIQPVSIVNVVSNVFFQRISSLVIVIQANPLSLELTAGDDADGAAWFDIRQPLPELAFDADRYIIEKYKECLEKGTSMSFIPLSDRESSFEQE